MNNRGFIALISVVIISMVLLVSVTGANLAGFLGRFNALDAELKMRSAALADACADSTMLELAVNNAYAGNATTAASGGQCYTGPVSVVAGVATFKTRGIYGSAYTNLKIAVALATSGLVSFEEIPQ